jgi:predicted ABC-type ATPase
MKVCDAWTIVDNMDLEPEIIAKSDSFGKMVINTEIWNTITSQSHEKS